MKPSGALSALARHANLSNGLALRNSNNNCDEGKETDAKYLDIRKDTANDSAAIFDHSYTSTLWHKSNVSIWYLNDVVKLHSFK